MPNLTASVDQGGRNLVHDVAVVQAALAVLKGSDLKPLWPGPVDGQYQRHASALAAAIAAFQARERQPATGRIDTTGPAPQALERVPPPSHKNLAGLKSTAVVFRGPGGFRPWEVLARETETSAPLPKAERHALAALQKRIGEELGLCLGIAEAAITRDGRFEVRLTCAETEWLDPVTKRFRIDVHPHVLANYLAALFGRSHR